MIYDIASGTSLGATKSTDDPNADGSRSARSQSEAVKADKNSVRKSQKVAGSPARAAMPSASTTTFFAERLASAFPGVRSLTWYEDRGAIATRLLALLREPLSFSNGTPIWWWRGGNLHIEIFKKIGPDVFLMNIEELKIVRVAAVPGNSYQRSFVYVQTDAMEPTGLYPDYQRRAQSAEYLKEFGYSSEEYGLFDGKQFLNRAEYDDGHGMIEGKLVNTAGRAELRVRHTSPYNFLIAAQGSPINSPEFDDELENILNSALQGNADDALKKIQTRIKTLRLRDTS
jgi:hypothetical protein